PDGRRLASGSGDYSIRIWNRNGRQLAIRDKINGIPFSFRWAKEAGPSSPNGVQSWEVEGAFLRYLVGGGGGGLVLSPDDSTFVRFGPNFGFHLQNIASGKRVAAAADHPTNWNPSAAWSPDGSMLATTTPHDASILIWSTATGEMVRTLAGHRFNPTFFAWS